MTHEFEPEADKSNVLCEFEAGTICNYYGGLTVAKTTDAMGNEYYWWSIEGWNGHHWEQIGAALYEELTTVRSIQRIGE